MPYASDHRRWLQPMNDQHCRREKPEGDERRADRAEDAAEPHEGGDPGDDGGGRQHDCDLGQAASEFVMSEPAIGQFPSFRGLLGSILDRIHAVFRLLWVFFVSRHGRFEVRDLLLERLLRFGIGHRAFLRFEHGRGRLHDRRANSFGLVEIEEVGGFDVFFRRQVLGVFGAGFGKRQQQSKNGDDERDRLTLFFRLDRGLGGFRHDGPSGSSGAQTNRRGRPRPAVSSARSLVTDGYPSSDLGSAPDSVQITY